MNKMKVVVTGASGFVGRNLLLRVPADWKVFAVFNSSADFRSFVKRHCGRNVIPVKCDLRDNSQVKRLKNKIGGELDLVLYFASNTNPTYSVEEPAFDLDSNVSALINFFENFVCKRAVYFSSLAVYTGLKGPVTVDSRINPLLPYAISKVAAEQYIKFYSGIKKRISSYVIIRFFGAYGPYESGRKIFTKLIEAFLIKRESRFKVRGDGKNYLDAMYVEDAVNGILKVAGSKVSNITVNFGSGKPLTVNEMVKLVGSICGVKELTILHEGKAYEYGRFRMGSKDMKNKFSFEPGISLEAGIKKFAKFLAEDRRR
jgi:nucleoside-diphosphate-sugar epimerase